jgi:hypothetical protein
MVHFLALLFGANIAGQPANEQEAGQYPDDGRDDDVPVPEAAGEISLNGILAASSKRCLRLPLQAQITIPTNSTMTTTVQID